MSQSTTTAPSSRRPAVHQSLSVFLGPLVLVELFSGVLQIYFSPVYSMLAAKFGVGIGTLSWSLTGFTLAAAVSTPVFCKLGDVYGHRRILRILVAIVAAGSVLIAAAPTFSVLVAGRVLQGMFPAYLPLMFGLVRDRYGDDDTKRAISYLTSILIFGVVFGLVAVGLITRYTSGPTWALWLPAIGTLVGFAGLMLVRGERVERRTDLRVDWTGAIMLGVGFALLLLGISEGSDWGWASARVVGSIVLGVVVLVAWALIELRIEQPLADLRWLFKPHFVPIYVVGFCTYFAVLGGQVVGSTFMAAPSKVLGYGLGLSPFGISMWLALTFFVMFLGVISTARLGKAIGFRTVMMIGAILAAVGFLGLVVWHGNLFAFVLLTAVAVGGMGFIESSTRTLVVGGLRDGEVSMGEGIYELSISLGPAVGSAVMGAVLSANASKIQGLATEHGYRTSWVVMGLVCLLAAVVAIGFFLSGRRHRST
ncbi:MFS transporter [Leekyejoonella antrihumi]|uniref:MFS transporter n=1 Tax=Leekyejoonella antrihumi TaxID=1660198 RepID=A0A563E8K9_9MICO|nr:MFS transporter [Leekyejoonella antrihumi]TWP38541.1 MFS transporter [Leekyejoonella antrihumi]